MYRQQLRGENLVRLDEVTDVRLGEMPAGVAVTALLDGREVLRVLQLLHALFAFEGHGERVARRARLHHAVEHIDSAHDSLDQAVGAAHAHEIAGFFKRHIGTDGVEHIVHDALGLAHGKPAYAVAGQIHSGERLCAFYAKVREHAALHYAEQRLIRPCVSLFAALRPAVRAVHRLDGVIVAAARGSALVERHRNVGTQSLLHLHNALGREEMAAAVDVGMELHPVLFYLVHGGEAEHLEAAAVGQHGPVPLGEFVQASGLFDELVARTQVEVIGVGKHYARADLL